MNIYKKALLSMLILSSSTSIVIAEETFRSEKKNFGAITLSPSTKDGVIYNQKFDGDAILGFYVGRKKMLFNTVGLYGGYEFSPKKVDVNGNSRKISYTYSILNLGLTFSLGDKFTLMTGVGKSKERASFVAYGTLYESKESKTKNNYNVEAMYRIGKSVGVIAGYNSAPDAYNLGLSFAF
jgi:hypothetical protein